MSCLSLNKLIFNMQAKYGIIVGQVCVWEDAEMWLCHGQLHQLNAVVIATHVAVNPYTLFGLKT